MPGNASRPGLTVLRQLVGPALRAVVLLTFLTGIAFPLVLAGISSALFPDRARGSLITRDGVVVGAAPIGQRFSDPRYFHPRPSAAGDGYNAATSGGTNLGPAHPRLREEVRRFADTYRRRNRLPATAILPVDAVTRSGSGLDPHISPEDAALQTARVARARQVSEEALRRLVAAHTQRRQFGFLGAPVVAVLPLNLALDQLASPPAR